MNTQQQHWRQDTMRLVLSGGSSQLDLLEGLCLHRDTIFLVHRSRARGDEKKAHAAPFLYNR